MKINILKTSYRRNLVIGNVISGLVAAIVILVLILLEEPYVSIKVENNKYIESFAIPPKKSLDVIHEQNNAEILTDGNFRDLTSDSFIYGRSLYPAAQFMSGELFQHDFIFPSENYKGGDDVGHQQNKSGIGAGDWPVADQNSLIGKYSFNYYSSSREISPPPINRSLIIDFKKPRYPPGLRIKVDAVVTLGFHLSESGTITKFDVIKEEPEGYGFALAVKEALRESWIKAAVVDGRKKGGYYILTYEFCEKCPSRPVVIESSPNVMVTIK